MMLYILTDTSLPVSVYKIAVCVRLIVQIETGPRKFTGYEDGLSGDFLYDDLVNN